MAAPIVGIDLGTTNSLVAVSEGAGPRVIEVDGRGLVPSVVRYEVGDGGAVRVVVGDAARAGAVDWPRQTVSSVKRLMGRSADDAAGDLRFLSYEVVAGERDTARVRVPLADGRVLTLSPEEVSARVLAELKARASKELGLEVTRAVVTVPAYFDDAQRQATRTAGRLAGLEVVRIVPEPTAAALAYGIGVARGQGDRPTTVVVYDLGGGTFDVSVLRLTPPTSTEPGETYFFQVLATGGDTHLGGDDADHLLVDLFSREIAGVLGVDAGTMELPPGVRKQLVQLAESVKVRLSEFEEARVEIALDGGRSYERVISRGELEGLIGPLVERTIAVCRQVARDAGIEVVSNEPTPLPPPSGRGSLDAVIMVGGSTRVPLVRRRVGEFFGVEPYTALDPDRVVALGAAVQASLLDKRTTGTLLLDVIPLSLGVETVGGAVAKLITANSTIPARATEMFSTSVDGQTSIRLTVYQGEREMAADCRKLGEFHLRGLPPMPAGIPQLEVQFLVDANGVLSVSAHERRSGKRAGLQVVPNHGLSGEEVERIERESLLHAREDMARHRVVDLIVNSRLDLKWIGERFAKFEGELEAGYREELRGRIERLKGLLAAAQADWTSVDPDEFYRAKNDLDQASVRLQEVSISASLRAES